MRTNKASKRKRQNVRVPARPGLEVDVKVGADMPRCITCGQPLVRLPRFLASRSADHGFQCQRCFYKNSAPAPSQSEVISSDRTRWLSEVLSEPGQPSTPPPPPAEAEE